MTAELQQRVVSALVMGIVFLSAVFMGGGVFAFLITAISLVIWHEWFAMNIVGGDDRAYLIGAIALGLAGMALAFLSGTSLLVALIVIFAASIGILLSWAGAKDGVAGLIYAGGFLLAMVMLRGEYGYAPGLFAIAYLCAVVWLTDIGAYFAGRFFGGPKLAPAISPNKTISGALGGILAGVLGAAIVATFAQSAHLGTLITLAVMVSVVSQCGDLFESWLKRTSGVKDSGSFIPGHGGAMDRVDGLLFAAIFLWLVSSTLGSWNDPAAYLFS